MLYEDKKLLYIYIYIYMCVCVYISNLDPLVKGKEGQNEKCLGRYYPNFGRKNDAVQTKLFECV